MFSYKNLLLYYIFEMKRAVHTFIAIAFCWFSFLEGSAQGDFSSNSNSGLNSFNSLPTPSPNEQTNFLNPSSNALNFQKQLEMDQQKKLAKQKEEQLKNKGIVSENEIYRNRIEQEMSEINKNYPKVDQFLGSFNSTTKNITVACRDFQYPDGDAVTIYVNDQPIVRNIILTRNYQNFSFTLNPGVNIISFKALNQGSSGPNTAGFVIYDDSENVVSANEWNLATGAKASLTILKDH